MLLSHLGGSPSRRCLLTEHLPRLVDLSGNLLIIGLDLHRVIDGAQVSGGPSKANLSSNSRLRPERETSRLLVTPQTRQLPVCLATWILDRLGVALEASDQTNSAKHTAQVKRKFMLVVQRTSKERRRHAHGATHQR